MMKKKLISNGLLRLVFVALVAVSTRAGAAAPAANLPVVISAAVPFYPDQARTAAVEGKIKLTVETDGERVTRVLLIDGQPLLAKAAKENLLTWVFKRHIPTSFDVLYSYKLSQEHSCEPDSGIVSLRFPKVIEVVVTRLQTCDPIIRK